MAPYWFLEFVGANMTQEQASVLPQEEHHAHGGFRNLVQQFRIFLTVLWSSEGRNALTLLTIAIIAVICITAGGQIALNAWNKPFYDAIESRNLPAFGYQLLVFLGIAGGLLALNVAQAWLREMIQLKSREWLNRDLFAQWLRPGRAVRLAYAGEIGSNPDQRMHEDARHLTELSASLGIGLFQASLLLVSFIGVLWALSGDFTIPFRGYSFAIPGYMVWCALIFAATGSWLTWLVGRRMVGMNASRYAREAELRFALVQANEHAQDIAQRRGEAGEEQRLNKDLQRVLDAMRVLVGATAELTWVTAGYGWISIVAPIVIASPGYFAGKLSFGELMMVVGAFYQVNQSLRWFVDNFSALADWRATLLRVMSFRETLLTFEGSLGGEERINYRDADEPKLALRDVGLSASGEKASLDAKKVNVLPGDRVLVLDETGSGKLPLFPAITGHWPWGSGKLRAPPGGRVMFLDRHPYFPTGSLRAALAYPAPPETVSDAEATAALKRVGLAHLAKRLDRQRRWERKLSPDEQARLCAARLLLHRPEWVFSETPIDTISEDERELLNSLFEAELNKTAFVTLARREPRASTWTRIIRVKGS
jgi:putative ATP-binding cassette transporter